MNEEEKKELVKWITRIAIIVGLLAVGTILINSMFFRHEEALVYVTKTGECYHAGWCHYLKSIIEIGLEEAKKAGYRACSYCHGSSTETIVVDNYPVSFLITAVLMGVGWFGYIWYQQNNSSGDS